MAKALVWITGLFFVVYGIAFTLLPVEMAKLVVGGSPDTASGIIDMRATYGGMSIAVGVVILMLGLRPGMLSTGLLIIAVVLLGLATGRIVGIVMDGNPNTVMYAYLVAELVGGGLALLLRKNLK